MCPIPSIFGDRAISLYGSFDFGAQYCPSFPPYCATVWSMWIGVVSFSRCDCWYWQCKSVVQNTAHLHNAEYADMPYVYGFCDGSATGTVEEYRRRFLVRRIPVRRLFSEVFSTLFACFSVLMLHLNEHVKQHVERPASWSSGQGLWLLIMRSRVRFPVLPWEFFLAGKDSRGDHGLGS